MSTKGYGAALIEGLKPAIDLSEMGKVFQDTTQGLSAKLADMIQNTFGIKETDNLIITPKLSRGSAGISDISATVFFITDKGGNNIFYRGKGGNNQSANGRTSLVNLNGNGGGTGHFGTSKDFDKVMKPLCKVNEKGNPIMNLKSVPGHSNVAMLELDFSSLMCLALGIDPKDNYDFLILSVVPIGSGDNFSITLMKYITGGDRKGKTSGINYSRIETDLFNRANGGGNRGGNGSGRSY